jgi:hypothetical protein
MTSIKQLVVVQISDLKQVLRSCPVLRAGQQRQWGQKVLLSHSVGEVILGRKAPMIPASSASVNTCSHQKCYSRGVSQMRLQMPPSPWQRMEVFESKKHATRYAQQDYS